MRVPAAQQQLLLELQSFDTRLARLAHEARTLPVLARLEQANKVLGEQDVARVRLDAAVADQRRELTRLEDDIAKVVARRDRHLERLGSGGVPAKEVQAIQAEVDHLQARQSVLEDEQLESMEAAEQVESERQAILDRLAAIAADISDSESERDTELGRLRAATAGVQAQRDALALQLPGEIVDLYDEVRASTGGLGVVAVSGGSTDGVSIDFTLSELDAIRTADPDTVLQSEEYGYILVR